ncbi:response regulator [Tolypothrix sp. FACHB-123]|uniref:response regulator n=1 Tax=Tolypothrix sp. FACHB-123 TaxID=2692868 RepID=UPI001689A317|nr:response regulator [Tolypothrix sp. FACHB-123]MBD2358142.1 response regulator [Tolypothrix sp. FACHB-123]
MPKFLIVEDEANIRRQWRGLLESENHSCQEAEDIFETLEVLIKNQNDPEDFDLIILDHHLGSETGLDAIEAIEQKVGKGYCQYRVVVITGHSNRNLATEYVKLGSIGHLLKPVSPAQFWVTIEAALERRYIYIEQREDWEKAYEVLENLGILESVDKLRQVNVEVNEQYEILRATYEKLLEELEKSKGNEQEIGEAYRRAAISLNKSPGSIDSILPFIQPFQYKEAFWKDIENLFQSDRLGFYILQTYLKRIADNPKSLPIKLIAGTDNYYEYRVGSAFRLYYRKDGNVISLERFGHKKLQEKIIKYLREN